MKALHGAFYCLIALTGVGCDLLNVTNNNNPNREAALGTPTDLENFVGFLYAVAHSGTLGGAAIPGCTEPCIDGLQAQMQTMGMENVSGLANFAMGPRSAIPRNPIDNTPGSQGNVGDYRDFTVEHRAARMASLAIAKINQFGTLGSDARTARARAFARFVQGVALGNLALAYDSAAILTETNNAAQIVPLSPYDTVMSAALRYLDSAIAIVAGPVPAGPATDWFPPPTAAPWINGVTLTAPVLAQIAHSYKARFRAGVARTPAERAAVDWRQVTLDAAAGITTDLNVTMAPSQG